MKSHGKHVSNINFIFTIRHLRKFIAEVKSYYLFVECFINLQIFFEKKNLKIRI